MKTRGHPVPHGRGLVDLLVVLVVLGLLATWIIPQLTGGTAGADPSQAPIQAADTTKDESNARNIAAMTHAIAAIGGQLPGSKEEIIAVLVAGTNVPFAGGSTRYQLSGLGPDEIAAASAYLELENARLVFRPRP